MTLQKRIETFKKLGTFINEFLIAFKNNEAFDESGQFYKLNKAIETSEISNPWFTKSNTILSLENITKQLSAENLTRWISSYNMAETNKNPKKIGVVMAGNIPLVGFHDFICVLISGNIFVGKLSSKDNILLKCIASIISELSPSIEQNIIFEENILKDFDAIIATGSNNSSMYFEHYFKNVPNIIRKNRNSVAILDGEENIEDIMKLGEDIFTYFGLGCRNISKIYLPEDYDLTLIFNALEHFSSLLDHNKYVNNYTYNQTLYLMKGVKFYDNGFALMIQENNISSPISVVHYEYYKNIRNLYGILESNNSQIQCVATNIGGFDKSVKLGNTQKPELWDYSDDIDTIKFLNSLN